MNIKIIFNNDSLDKSFDNGWGFSCLVDNSVLFDTGESADFLFNNIKRMDIDISNIDSVVISHDRWDHTGGLWDLLKERKGIKVYSCPGFSEEFKKKVKDNQGFLEEVNKFTPIIQNIYASGEIAGRYKGSYISEQVLVVKSKQGLTIITGCSHPGILRIIEKVKEEFPGEKINFVFGGFHLMDKDKREVKLIVEQFKSMSIKKAGPTHCTGYEAQAVFKEAYGDNFISIKAGQTLNI